MKTLHRLCLAFCMVAVVVSSGMAADDQLASRERIRSSVQYDPLGPNNNIVAFVTFMNENPYRVDVHWWPLITCEGENPRAGAAAGFSMNEGESYVVNIWRSSACGQGRISHISVEMEVKKAGR